MRHRLGKLACGLAAATLALGTAANPARAATAKEVDEAVLKAQKYLLSQIGKDGHCEVVPEMVKKDPGQADVKGWQWGGLTGIATYGILASGVKPNDPRIAPTIDWLAKAKIRGHYASGMRAQVWTFLPERQARASSTADFRLLLNSLIPKDGEGVKQGFYPYYTAFAGDPGVPSNADPRGPGVPQTKWYDRSVSQIAVLGMWACEQAGQEVPTLYWQIVDAAWKRSQQRDGGWTYKDDGDFNKVTATMTAAGVATLYITQDYLLRTHRWDVCKGGMRNEWIERGLAWIDRNAEQILQGNVAHKWYALYGIERIGVASGRKYFGTTDWYKVGADHIVKNQNANGSWGHADDNHNAKGIPDTVFATLFLVRGRAPVILSKLEYHNGNQQAPRAFPRPPRKARPSPPPRRPPPPPRKGAQTDPWNERPRDAANFAHWASKQTEQYLNWQIVNLKVPTSELHDAPILYLAGSEALVFDEAEVAKLRAFVEEGGVILGNADCGSPAFSKSFIALGQQLFNKYEFRDLPRTTRSTSTSSTSRPSGRASRRSSARATACAS
jgi:hypothetical protein